MGFEILFLAALKLMCVDYLRETMSEATMLIWAFGERHDNEKNEQSGIFEYMRNNELSNHACMRI